MGVSHDILAPNRTLADAARRGRPALSRSRAWLHCAVALGALGCANKDEPVADAFLEIEASDRATLAKVVPEVTTGGLLVHVRAVNGYRAAVASGELTVQVTGDGIEGGGQTLSLTPGPSGHATVLVPTLASGPALVEIIASADGLDLSEASGVSWSMDGEPPAFKIGAAGYFDDMDGEPAHAVAATNGIAFSAADKVWFQPADVSQRAWIVADVSASEVAGMESGHIDRDGILDLLVWAGNQAIVLKGREGGGYTWQGGWQAGFGAVAGGTIADVDSDRNTDIVLAASGESKATIVPLMGDGAWGFSPLEQLFLNTEVYDVAAADEGYDGRPVISVLTVASDTVRRYTLGDEGWVGAKTSELPGYAAQTNSSLLPSTDLDGDRSFETLIVGAPEANTQDIVMFVIQPEGSGSVNYPVPLPPLHAGVADMDLDGSLDIIASVDDELHVIGWDGQGFVDRRSEISGPRGPIAGSTLIHDEVPDLAVVTDVVSIYPGALANDGEWEHERFSWRSFNTALQGPSLFFDIDGDGITDILGFTTDSDLVLASWTMNILDTGEGELQFGGRTENGDLGDNAVPYGLVQCNGLVWSLTEGTSGTVLNRYSLSTGVPVIDATTETSGTLLACGLLPSGEQGVVVAQQTGFWRSYGVGLTPKADGEVGAVGAIALADTDGNGAGEVVFCPDTGCSVVAIDPDEDGVDAVVRSNGTTSTVTLNGEERVLAGGGLLSLGDVDLDGVLDVLAWSPDLQRGALWLTSGGTLAPGRGVQNDRPLSSPMSVGDMTGDGLPELIFVDDTGKVWHSEATSAE